MRTRSLLTATMMLLLAATLAWAQQGGVADQIQWDKSTVETIHGKIVNDQNLQNAMGDQMAQVMVRTDKETLPVILGPKSYLDTQNLKIGKDDEVDVKGSRVMINDAPTIIASQVKKEGETLKLRESDGSPMWTSGKNKP